jgi:hypothetical protein
MATNLPNELNSDRFLCRLSNENHLIKNDFVALECGHYGCKKCVKKNDIKCILCNIKVEMNAQNLVEIGKEYRIYLDNLFNNLLNQRNILIGELKRLYFL